ncbi:MAG: Holliday junction branch migration protein RuvA [Dehalococcoidia bacterium]|nr:Holliday junction branch migration protein RuvA [Dehalococcoidia bacterium]
MISSIHGALERVGPNLAIVRVGGFSMKVNVPALSLNGLGAPGTQVDLHTHLHVREDLIALYGFSTEEELALFEALITVSGVGPKLALSILSVLSPEQVALAIASGNPDALTGVPGIGKKIAARITLELKGKLEKEWFDQKPGLAPESSDILAALGALGYSAAEAMQAVSHLPPGAGAPIEERVTAALRYLGRE